MENTINNTQNYGTSEVDGINIGVPQNENDASAMSVFVLFFLKSKMIFERVKIKKKVIKSRFA